MSYALLLERDEVERRIRLLAAQGWRVRDLASLFHVHPLLVQQIIASINAAT